MYHPLVKLFKPFCLRLRLSRAVAADHRRLDVRMADQFGDGYEIDAGPDHAAAALGAGYRVNLMDFSDPLGPSGSSGTRLIFRA